MKNQKFLLFLLCATLTLVCFQVAAVGQPGNDKLANMVGSGSSVRLDVLVSNSGSTLIISAPDGRTFRKDYKAGVAPEFIIIDKAGERLPDGVYTYELRLAAAPGVLEKLRTTRARDDDSEADRTSRKRLILPNLVQSGSFTIQNGGVIVAGAVEDSRRTASIIAPRRVTELTVANTLARFRNHRTLATRPDDVIPDDLIVQGSACVGLDCVNGEVFGFDTIRMKENNTRLQFDDTSTSQGFPTNNWQIRANDSASGGSSFLGFVDQGSTGNSETGTIVGRFDAGAPANSFKVASNGKVGLRTATPVLDIHMNTSDTPAVRFEQNNSGGFTAQTWDIGANEANFFVRDVTGGSRLPFRIRPGAPTSSIDIAASGNVGVNTSSPGSTLDVSGNIITMGSDSGTSSRTTSTIKLARLSLPPFVSTDLKVAMLVGATTSTANIVAFGGEAAGFAAATQVDFVTAATTNVDTGTVRMTINSSGNVGIATALPTDTLSVNGTASKPGGGTWAVFSDERLKNIKGRFNGGLKAVMQLQPLRYQYKPDNALGLKSEGEYIGFGAQALQNIIPEAVTRNSNGYLMVNSDPILWTMLNAIKEQQKEIAELKTQVRKLQTTTRRRAR
jgi:hypothetical protein